MSLEKIPPVGQNPASLEADKSQKVKGKILPLKTGKAAGPVFEQAQSVPAEWPFPKAASLKDDLAPIKKRVQALAKYMHVVSPSEMLQEINRCKSGLEGMQKKLEELEFVTQFPLMGELDVSQKYSFASNLLSDAKRLL